MVTEIRGLRRLFGAFLVVCLGFLAGNLMGTGPVRAGPLCAWEKCHVGAGEDDCTWNLAPTNCEWIESELCYTEACEGHGGGT